MPLALIRRPQKSAMQSGRANTRYWLLEFEQATPREPDPLMGWTSAADTLNEVHLRFETLEEAIAFAKKRGYDYAVVPHNQRRMRPKSYADNFRYDRPR